MAFMKTFPRADKKMIQTVFHISVKTQPICYSKAYFEI